MKKIYLKPAMDVQKMVIETETICISMNDTTKASKTGTVLGNERFIMEDMENAAAEGQEDLW